VIVAYLRIISISYQVVDVYRNVFKSEWKSHRFFGISQMPIDSFNTNLWWWYDGDRSIESLRLITTTHQPEATRCSLSDAQI